MDRILAVVAALLLAGFLGTLLAFVPRLDLVVVIGITFLLVLWDFFVAGRRGGRRERR